MFSSRCLVKSATLLNVCCHIEEGTVLQESAHFKNKVWVIPKWALCLFHIKLWCLWWTLTAFYLSLDRSTTNASAITPRMLLLQCSRTQGQVGWKREHALWMLSKCLQSDLFSQRTLYSCINAFQDACAWFAACLMDFSPLYPPVWAGLCTFWPWCQQRQKEAAVCLSWQPKGHSPNEYNIISE